jgi:hypothetical protein
LCGLEAAILLGGALVVLNKDTPPQEPAAETPRRPTGDEVVINDKINEQAKERGWTEEEIRDATNQDPAGTSTDNTNGRNDPATVYGKPGEYVVVNDKTGEVVQISNKNNPEVAYPVDSG